jgi:catechol 2,3-dioxygenase-like lactoylglutathione lyase family enzyme
VVEEMVPVFRVVDAVTAAQWYRRLGFEIVGEHRFGPDLPLYLFLERNQVRLHLSEHTGDAPPNSLVYFWVDDVDSVAAEFGVEVGDEPWAREIQLVDPDGNRLRVGTAPKPALEV